MSFTVQELSKRRMLGVLVPIQSPLQRQLVELQILRLRKFRLRGERVQAVPFNSQLRILCRREQVLALQRRLLAWSIISPVSKVLRIRHYRDVVLKIQNVQASKRILCGRKFYQTVWIWDEGVPVQTASVCSSRVVQFQIKKLKWSHFLLSERITLHHTFRNLTLDFPWPKTRLFQTLPSTITFWRLAPSRLDASNRNLRLSRWNFWKSYYFQSMAW